MTLTGTPDEILASVLQTDPHIQKTLDRAAPIHHHRAIEFYQAAALARFIQHYDGTGLKVLEIGTAVGYSTIILAESLPHATITTLNPQDDEAERARANLVLYAPRITVVERRSWDFYAETDETFDLIFVDGDHKNIRRDLVWWDRLNVGGAMIFHDFSPNGSTRPCPPVYRALLDFTGEIRREPDFSVIDNTGVGMVGWVKGVNDMLQNEERNALATAFSYSSASYETIGMLYRLARAQKDVPGALVECGCQNGGSAAALAYGLGDGHRVWLFDNFKGVPEPDPVKDGAKAYQRWLNNQPLGWAKGNKADARAALKEVGIKGARIVEGEFVDVFVDPAVKVNEIAVLHIDATLHSSTYNALVRWMPYVSPGGIVILSAYHHWQGIREATASFFAGELPVLNSMEQAVWWRI